jgi:hypothetical protein
MPNKGTPGNVEEENADRAAAAEDGEERGKLKACVKRN